MYDRDSESETLSQHDFLGCVEFTLGRVMGSVGQCMSLNLQKIEKQLSVGRSDLGVIQFRAEELATSADTLQIQFTGTKLDNKDGFFSKSDPFLNIYRSTEDGKIAGFHFGTSNCLTSLIAEIPFCLLCDAMVRWDWCDDGSWAN